MIKLKKPDLITSILLLFLVSIPVIVLYFKTINTNIGHFAQKSEALSQLKLLDKEFNYFIVQKGRFNNYDIVNDKTEDFRETLQQLRESIAQERISENEQYLLALEKIQNAFKAKMRLLEHTKSYNSLIINSLNYLHDLQNRIKQYSPIDEHDVTMLNNTIFLTLQTFTGTLDMLPEVETNLHRIQQLAQNTNDKYLQYFATHLQNIVDILHALRSEHQQVKQLDLYQNITALQQRLQENFSAYLKVGKFSMITILGLLVTMLISVLYLYTRSLKDKQRLIAYRYAIENSDNSIIVTDPDHTITYVNNAFVKETGYNIVEAKGNTPAILKSGKMDPKVYETMHESLQKGERWEGEFINKRKDGTIFYEKASISPLIIDNTLHGYIAIKLNITKYIEQENRVKFLAYHDQLTTLPNRLHFEEHFKNVIRHADREYALFYIDLDYFKTINDTLGHHTGDKLLQIFAKRLRHALTKGDFIARIGGDEFVAVIPMEHSEKAKKVAGRILQSLHQPFVIEEHTLNITTSIGVSLYPRDGTTLDTLMKHADTAMYHAKSNGRNSFHFFTRQLSNEIQERLDIEQALRKALANEELYLVYQPKYDLTTRDILGFEALIRWENDQLGFVPPDKFIPIAEEIGLINEIGYFVFERACREFQHFKSIEPALKHIAINISTLQLRQSDFIQTLDHLRNSTALMAQEIELEMTESSIMQDVQHNIASLQTLRMHGYQIAVDDFGTGYSSLGYLKKLPITTLKIDKSFVDDICTQNKDRDIVETIITMSHNLGFTTVAEGIEDEAQERLLRKMECDIGQGYLFSRPLKPTDLITFLQKSRLEKSEDVLL